MKGGGGEGATGGRAGGRARRWGEGPTYEGERWGVSSHLGTRTDPDMGREGGGGGGEKEREISPSFMQWDARVGQRRTTRVSRAC